jgi:ribose transport system ATP-binding protein
LLTAQNITKKFAGVTALDNVCLELHPGKVNAIIGENGAGKSTLMKILSGVYQDYQGDIFLKGQPVRFASTKEAQEKGIAIIHQELNLIPYLTIAENIFLGRELNNKLGLLDKKSMHLKTRSLLQQLKLPLDPTTPVKRLKVGQQQVVEIAKALLLDSEVIIMDEPTSAISEAEVKLLFDIIRDLKNQNKTVVYISHKLDELSAIADTYTILRDGKTIESGEMQGITHDGIIRKMVGRDIGLVQKPALAATGKELIRVSNISLKRSGAKDDIVKQVSFAASSGEIIGIFGLMGAGRTELLETIFGLHPARSSGNIHIDQKEINIQSPIDAIRSGMALVPEDRKKDGIVAGMTVKKNISLTTLRQPEHAYLVNNNSEAALAGKYIKELAIKTSSPAQMVKNLSGGNQQKVVLAKWLATHPKVLLLDEPTRGIDVHAKSEIYKLIIQLAAAGLCIIMVSSELPEIFAVSDRVLVMSEGRLSLDIPVASATENILLKAAIPKTINEPL